MNILVVDDIAANRKLLRVQLEAEGFGVVEAADGIDALEVLTHERVDAVLSDILMPRMDGYRLCHEVRKNAKFRNLRFVLYSSTYTSPADVSLGDTVGADQFIAKPAPIAVIMNALQIPDAGRTSHSSVLPDDALIVQQYSAVLVAKLEEKNTELQQALEETRRAHKQIQELNVDLDRRVQERTAELAKTNSELITSLAEVKQLNGLLPICSYCKKIRDDKNYWESVEHYITRHTNSNFSHGICPECYEKHVTPMLKELYIESAARGDPSVP
jgi:CheY-like chemotaxis protein